MSKRIYLIKIRSSARHQRLRPFASAELPASARAQLRGTTNSWTSAPVCALNAGAAPPASEVRQHRSVQYLSDRCPGKTQPTDTLLGQLFSADGDSARIFECSQQINLSLSIMAMLVVLASTFTTSVGRAPSAAPSAASIDGMTIPGLYPASRNAVS